MNKLDSKSFGWYTMILFFGIKNDLLKPAIRMRLDPLSKVNIDEARMQKYIDTEDALTVIKDIEEYIARNGLYKELCQWIFDADSKLFDRSFAISEKCDRCRGRVPDPEKRNPNRNKRKIRS